MATTKTSPAKPKAPPKPRAPAKPRTPAKPRSATSSALGATSVLSVGAGILAVGAAIAGFLARRQIAAWVSPDDGAHRAPDLALNKPRPTADDRAPADFRPNIDAPISASEREALRPATGPAPSLAADAGALNSQTGAAN